MMPVTRVAGMARSYGRQDWFGFALKKILKMFYSADGTINKQSIGS